MIRVFMGRKKKVKICEWITTVGTGSWSVPEGCTSVDCCLIAGGASGGSAGGDWKDSFSGAGGKGGALVNIYNLDVSSVRSISYTVGGPGENSQLGNKNAVSGTGPVGGASIPFPGNENYALNGLAGKAGLFPFDNSKLFKACCRGGGSGAYVLATNSSDPDEGQVFSANGGYPNGGNATGYYWLNAEYAGRGYNGSGGTYYGDGGGGGGFSRYGPFGKLSKGSGGRGHQGCIILMYERNKLPTDVIDPETKVVKINWPENAYFNS